MPSRLELLARSMNDVELCTLNFWFPFISFSGYFDFTGSWLAFTATKVCFFFFSFSRLPILVIPQGIVNYRLITYKGVSSNWIVYGLPMVPIGVGAASTPLKRVYIPCRFLSLIPKFYRYPINNDNNAEEIRKTFQKAPCFFCFVFFFF